MVEGAQEADGAQPAKAAASTGGRERGHRIGLVAIAAALALLAVAVPTATGQASWPTYDADPWTGVPGGDVDPKVDAIVSPLASTPTILEDGDQLRVEVDPARVDADPAEIDAHLSPSFGAAQVEVPLRLAEVATDEPSEVWPDREVTALTFEAIQLSREEAIVEDLYDLHLSWGPTPVSSDVQPRAVSLVDSFPDRPRVVVIADPSVGDPRPIQEGAQDSVDQADPRPAAEWTLQTVGVPTEDEGRWGALQKTIQEVNLVDPDIVLVAGDLTFGLYPRPLTHEYEDAYTLINKIEAPTFLTPGNHDLYTFHEEPEPYVHDGKRLWPAYFGPWYYSVDLPGGLHLLSLNTYDHSQEDRVPVGPDGIQPSGGGIGDEQLAWLTGDLLGFRQSNPDGKIVSFAHHDPSWKNGSHPWFGPAKLELRDLLADVDAAVHFAGHKHNDRVARYHEGHVVETNGQAGGERGKLHYVLRNDTLDDGFTQAQLGEILREPEHGPLFVTTTTAASGLKGPYWGHGGWWGWRQGVLDWDGHGLDPAALGYPATESFVDHHAERPERWNADHAQYGLFSYPSFFLNRTLDGPNDGTRTSVTMTVENDLFTTESLVLPFHLRGEDPDAVNVGGGDIVKARTDGEEVDVWVEVTLSPGEERVVTANSPLGPPLPS